MYQEGCAGDAQRIAYLELKVAELGRRLPATWLLSDSFLKRAFAILGHYMVASMLIAIPFYALTLIVFVLVATLTGNAGGS